MAAYFVTCDECFEPAALSRTDEGDFLCNHCRVEQERVAASLTQLLAA